MPTKILMPALSPTMEKGNLAKWLKKEGDRVAPGDVIAEIETDKATMEVEAIDEGTLGKILIDEGTNDVPVNQPIAVLLAEGEDASAVDAPDAGFVQPAARPADAGSTEKTAAQVAKQNGASANVQGSPAARAPEQSGGEAGPVTPSGAPGATSGTGTAGPAGYGGAGELREAAQAESAAGTPSSQPPAAPRGGEAGPGSRDAAAAGARRNGQDRVFASPLARRLAKEAGIEIGRIQGSGPHGRVVARDVEGARSGKGLAPAPSAAPVTPAPAAGPAPVQAPPSDDKIRALFAQGSYESVPHDNMRRVIAQRLTEARRTVPQFYLTMDCEIDALLAVREQVNAAAPKDKDGKPSWKVSVNDMVVKALAVALMRVPDANVTWTESAMLKHKHADVGVAVALPNNGLITPIIRAAETKTLSVIAREMKDFAARAKGRKLKPEEYQGGTTAVSNLGMFGIKDFTAVINPPHSTILAVGAGEQRPVVRNGQLAVATVMSVTLSCDHRAVDGALGAQLIGTFKELIEHPMAMLA